MRSIPSRSCDGLAGISYCPEKDTVTTEDILVRVWCSEIMAMYCIRKEVRHRFIYLPHRDIKDMRFFFNWETQKNSRFIYPFGLFLLYDTTELLDSKQNAHKTLCFSILMSYILQIDLTFSLAPTQPSLHVRI